MEESTNATTIGGSIEIFEINDFTVVTEFEVFVLSMENVLQELKVEVNKQDDKNKSGKLTNIAERLIEYQNYQFQLDYCQWKENTASKYNNESRIENNANIINNAMNDFFEENVISKQYGISTNFVFIYTIGRNNYLTESKINMIMSAINVATVNINFELPILFQFAKGASVGIMQNRNCFTNFEGVVLDKCLMKHRYLDGIVEMFNQKVNSSIGCENEIKLSLQLDFQKNLNAQNEFDSISSGYNEKAPKCAHKYTFQLVDSSLLKELWIKAIWMDLSENSLVENETYTNIDPQQAHRWKLEIKFDEEFTYELAYLFSRLIEHQEEEYSLKTVRSQLPISNTDSSGSLAANAFGPLLDKPAINFEIVPKFDIFADEDDSYEGISACFENIMQKEVENDVNDEDLNEGQQYLLNKLSLAKSAPKNSLARKLATCLMSRIDQNFPSFCRLWMKFLDILRHNWEYNLDLPGFNEDEIPNLGYCLLHQKLQMLQHCIFVKRNKHNEMDIRARNGEKEENDDEEFYDAIEEFDESTAETSMTFKPMRTPKGRSHPLEPPEFLKNYPNKRIYVPITQSIGPMTEDQLAKHELYLVSLEDTNSRHNAQSDLLLSDMQAFKAANPGAVLEDFLVWHSPRDLIDGEMSERMQLPGNLWKEQWKIAHSIPSAKQRRLFNETKEVEEILQSLNNIKLKDLIDLLFPIVSEQFAAILIKNSSICIGQIREKNEKLIDQIQYATKTMGDRDAFYDISDSLCSIQSFLVKYSTFVNLLEKQATKRNIPFEITPSIGKFIGDLCNSELNVQIDELSLKSFQFNIEVPNSSEEEQKMMEVIKSFMANEDNLEETNWANPKRKQCILRRIIQSPGPESRQMPHRMYTSYQEGEFLLNGAFTSDATFM